MGPRAGLDDAENLVPPGFDPRTVQSVDSHYTHYTIPAHRQIPVHLQKNLTSILSPPPFCPVCSGFSVQKHALHSESPGDSGSLRCKAPVTAAVLRDLTKWTRLSRKRCTVRISVEISSWEVSTTYVKAGYLESLKAVFALAAEKCGYSTWNLSWYCSFASCTPFIKVT